jgi:uncharacterized coiled-coil protein SlyX
MKCHYVYDQFAGKVWIPGCWGGINGPTHCYCDRGGDGPETYPQFERRLYNEQLKKMADKIDALNKANAEKEKEIYRLNRVIRNLLRKLRNRL